MHAYKHTYGYFQFNTLVVITNSWIWKATFSFQSSFNTMFYEQMYNFCTEAGTQEYTQYFELVSNWMRIQNGCGNSHELYIKHNPSESEAFNLPFANSISNFHATTTTIATATNDWDCYCIKHNRIISPMRTFCSSF